MIKGQYLNSLHPPNVFKYLVATVKQRRGRQHNNCDWLERTLLCNEELVLKYTVGYRNHDIFKVCTTMCVHDMYNVQHKQAFLADEQIYETVLTIITFLLSSSEIEF